MPEATIAGDRGFHQSVPDRLLSHKFEASATHNGGHGEDDSDEGSGTPTFFAVLRPSSQLTMHSQFENARVAERRRRWMYDKGVTWTRG